MRAEIELGSAVTATLTSYFAATSNSVQFGGGFYITATVEFLFVDYTASGWFEFDVLFEFDPFRIVADVAAGCTSAPAKRSCWGSTSRSTSKARTPWYASCHARFKFFLVNVKFNFTVGGHALPDAPESADVLELMDAQLDLPAAWSIETPRGVVAGVVLRDDEATSLLRPDSRIIVRQTVAPLNRDLAAFGNCIARAAPDQRRGVRPPRRRRRCARGRDQHGPAGLVRAEPVQRDARRAAPVGPELRADGCRGVVRRRGRQCAHARQGPDPRSRGTRDEGVGARDRPRQ